eukprot:gene15746-17678_t
MNKVPSSDQLDDPTLSLRRAQPPRPLRYVLIRAFTCPVTWIPRSFPIVGGKSFFELFVAFFFLVLFLALGFSDSLTAGSIVNFMSLVLVSLSIRNNVIAAFFGLTFEFAIFWHKALGCLLLLLVLVHGIGQGYRLTGVVMAVAMGLMALLYFVSRSTKDNFNLFYFGHITLYLVLIIPAFLHGAVVLGASVFLWLLDVLIRYVFTKKTVKADLSVLSGDIVKISVPGGSFAYEAGQYCFLRVSMVNGYEYHPFTISSDGSEEKISFHVRKSGDWTTQLYDMVKEKAKTTDPSGSGNMLSVEGEVAVEGPYGRLSIDLFNSELYETVVLIGGGIGITPCLSVWKHLLQSVSKPKKVVFVWVVREGEAAEKMYADQFEGRVDEEREIVFQETSSSLVKEDTRFQYHFHVTRHVDDPLDRVDLEAESRQARKRRWNAGRLKMRDLFQDVASYASFSATSSREKARVGVLVCGPFSLINEVANVRAELKTEVSFEVHEEFFEL